MEHLRTVRLSNGRADFYLSTWETGNRAPTGQWLLAYRFADKDGMIFEGEEFGCSPFDAINSDGALRGLLTFLLLKPGDTDDEYFKKYTKRQRAFTAEHAEDLDSLYSAYDGDETEAPEPFVELDPEDWRTPNARFWVADNGGWVKVTLRPNQQLNWFTRETTEEGWSSQGVSWYHNGKGIERTWHQQGRDCDGRHGTSGEDFCPLEELDSFAVVNYKTGHHLTEENGMPMFRPQWKEAKPKRCYDENAEKAGY